MNKSTYNSALLSSYPLHGEASDPRPIDPASNAATDLPPLFSHEVPADSQQPASFKIENGIQFSDPATSSKAHLGVLIQQDWGTYLESESIRMDPDVGDLQEAVFFRRARIKFDGSTRDFIEWDFDSEQLSNDQVVFDDLWMGVKNLPRLGNIRVGHVKLPQGLESITSNRVFTFLERAAPFDAFYREYGPGFLVFNNYLGDNGLWAVCFHRIDATGNGIDVGDGEYAATGRLTWVPLSGCDDAYLVHLGASASIRAAKWDRGLEQRVVRFRSRPEFRIARQTPFLVDTGLIPADNSVILGTELAVISGRWSLQAEYTAAGILGRDGTMTNPSPEDLWFHGAYVQASCFLTGEHRPYDRRLGRMARLTPLNPVGKGSLRGGAWEWATRYSWVDLVDRDVDGGQMAAWTTGLNWYWTSFFRTQWNYVLTERDQAGSEGWVHGMLMRLSFDF